MSRLGKVPITLPEGVEVSLDQQPYVKVKGPKGELEFKYHKLISVRREDGQLWGDRNEESREGKAQQGLVHRSIKNMITGVTEGFRKQLEIVGVGYRAALEGKELVLSLGYSHPVRYQIPEDININVERNVVITVEGIDKQKVGQTAAEIRSLKKPDSYKGKGIRYSGEQIKLKPGKAADMHI